MKKTFIAGVVLAVLLALHGSRAMAACKTDVRVYFDVSSSTESSGNVEILLKELKAATDEIKVALIPFGSVVAPPCAEFNPKTEDYSKIFDEPCNEMKTAGIARKTDLIPLLGSISTNSIQPMGADSRRIFVIFSDFIQSTEENRDADIGEWTRDHIGPLGNLDANLKKIPGQDVLFVLQEGRNGDYSTEITQIGALLRELFKVADSRRETGLVSSIAKVFEMDRRPLEIKIERISSVKGSIGNGPLGKLRVKIHNPSCRERKNIAYQLRPEYVLGEGSKARIDSVPGPTRDPVREGVDCPVAFEPNGKAECDLFFPSQSTGSLDCQKYVLRAEAKIETREDLMVKETGGFSLDNCFEPQALDFDLLRNVDGAVHLQGCCLVREGLKDNKDERWSEWRKADLKVKGDIEKYVKENDLQEFVACVQAKGNMIGKQVRFTLGFPERRTTVVSVEDRLVHGTPPEGAQYFPVFFAIPRKRAQAICYRPHDEMPDNRVIDYAVLQGGQSLADGDGKFLLTRARNREVEEELHETWESLIVPACCTLLLALLAVRSSRARTSGTVEEYLAIIGVGILILAAAFHDASNLGDWFENKYSEDPILYSRTCLVLVSAAFSVFLLMGAFEPRLSAWTARRWVSRTSLAYRTGWFWVRFSTWLIIIAFFCGSGYLVVSLNPKDIQECHYKGLLSKP